MVRLRLQRFGRKNRPYYRLAAIDQRARREGPVLENLGTYDPVNPKKDQQVKLNSERIKHWLTKGAVPSETVRDMLAKLNLVDVKLWEKDREHDRKRLADRLAKKAAEGEKKEEKKA